MSRRLSLLLLIVIAFAARPSGQTSTWRPVVMADHGMVSSGHPLASEAGMRILKAGGNAIDAAVAAWAVQGLTEPHMTGLGGDAFILIYLAKTREVKFINATGQAPMAATVDFYKSKGGLPEDGPLSVIVPGAVGGMELALQKYGSKPIGDVLAPAIDLAENGYPITESLGNALRGSREKLAKAASTRKIWFNGDEPLQMGDRVVQKDYGATLRAIAAKGTSEFYKGATATKVATYVKSVGGILEASDLAAYAPHEDTAISVNYKGLDVYECPPNSQGFVMLQALNILEGMNVRYMRHNSAPYLHAVTESLKLAFADRNRYVGDPKFVPPIPMRELLSKEYATKRRALIDPDKAIEGEPAPGVMSSSTTSASVVGAGFSRPAGYAAPQPVPALDPTPWVDGHTTYLAVVDKDRNMVSITSSLLSGFGSYV